jgi:hypothetical protein
MVETQMALMNERYVGTLFRFKHMDPDNPMVLTNNTYASETTSLIERKS